MDSALLALLATAAFIGTVHTLAGPDHYVPFIAMARARGWRAGRTAAVTLACGTGHVAGSVALGAVGIALGLALGRMEWIEAFRGDVAGWLLLGFGLAYAAWGLRQAWKKRPHRHWHGHGDGVVHDHEHGHAGEHAHVHGAGEGAARTLTPWLLFVIFVFGPCEALIPVLMVPAAEGSWGRVALVTAVFAATTLATMTAVVLAAHHGLSRLPLGPAERYAHALAGAALAACGAGIQLGL
jgi:ABC-type nickel/cobalt efflux system permease component RcnA